MNTNEFLVLIYGPANPFFGWFPLDLFSFKGTDLAESGISRCLNMMARPTLYLQKYFLEPDGQEHILRHRKSSSEEILFCLLTGILEVQPNFCLTQKDF